MHAQLRSCLLHVLAYVSKVFFSVYARPTATASKWDPRRYAGGGVSLTAPRNDEADRREGSRRILAAVEGQQFGNRSRRHCSRFRRKACAVRVEHEWLFARGVVDALEVYVAVFIRFARLLARRKRSLPCTVRACDHGHFIWGQARAGR